MHKIKLTAISVMLVALSSLLFSCSSDTGAGVGPSSVETSTSKGLSPETRARYLRLWNQSGLSSKTVTWPSDGVDRYTSSGLFLTGLGTKLPASLASRYGKDPEIRQIAQTVYQKAILRGMDTDLASKYMRTSFGRRELRGTYLFHLSRKCHGRTSKEQNAAFMAFYENGSPAPKKFVCTKNSAYSEKSLP